MTQINPLSIDEEIAQSELYIADLLNAQRKLLSSEDGYDVEDLWYIDDQIEVATGWHEMLRNEATQAQQVA